MRTATTTPSEAARLVMDDHGLLADLVDGLSEAELRAPYRVVSGPLGHFCDSLHDLTAHILMWDEITLAVLRDAAAGRLHWSLDPRWETADAGSALNVGGVEAGRHIPSGLLLHRFHSVADALVAEIRQYDDDAWNDPATGGGYDGGIGALAEYAATPPDGVLFGHAARHLEPAQVPA
ncbi:hypothetical protein ACWCOV_01065 [Kribbella sp. NPDC002412]